MLLFTCPYNPNVLIDAWKRLTASAGKGAHLGSGFIGCGEFQRFVQVKSSQFGFGKRLINRTKRSSNPGGPRTALKVVGVRSTKQKVNR